MGSRSPSPGGSGAVGERTYNGRVLLEHAATELRAELHPHPYEVGLAVGATVEVLEVLYRASRTLGVDPPELANLRPWALTLVERATRPAQRRSWRW